MSVLSPIPSVKIGRKPRIYMPVESLKELVSMVPIELGECLFRMNSPAALLRLLVHKSSKMDAGDRLDKENLPAFSQLEMFQYLKTTRGVYLWPEKPGKTYKAMATVATANSQGDGALADALDIYYGEDAKHTIFITKTTDLSGLTIYGATTDRKKKDTVRVYTENIHVEDIAYRPNDPHVSTIQNNWEKIADQVLQNLGGNKIAYFCGYGCVTIPQSEDHKHKLWTYREEWQTRISLVNMLIAFKVMAPGANFCNKIQDGHSKITSDLAWITRMFFEKVEIYEPSCMGWIGRRYIIGTGFRQPNSLEWKFLLDLAREYESPKGIPISLLDDPEEHETERISFLQKEYEPQMKKCDVQMQQDFVEMFGFLVTYKKLWEQILKSDLSEQQTPDKSKQNTLSTVLKSRVISVLGSHWRQTLERSRLLAKDMGWKERKQDPNATLSVDEKSDVEKIALPQKYVDIISKHADLLYSMANNAVISGWLNSKELSSFCTNDEGICE